MTSWIPGQDQLLLIVGPISSVTDILLALTCVLSWKEICHFPLLVTSAKIKSLIYSLTIGEKRQNIRAKWMQFCLLVPFSVLIIVHHLHNFYSLPHVCWSQEYTNCIPTLKKKMNQLFIVLMSTFFALGTNMTHVYLFCHWCKHDPCPTFFFFVSSANPINGFLCLWCKPNSCHFLPLV